MDRLLPALEIVGPDSQHMHVVLEKDKTTIGRFDAYNDIALDPDPQQLISRKAHCSVEHSSIGWWIVDNGSVNGIFFSQEGGAMQKVKGRALLRDGDCIRILGKLTEGGDAIYWELTFLDPMGTRPANYSTSSSFLEYDWLQAKLFVTDGSHRVEIKNLRPQEHKLIRYMDQRNRTNGNVPVMCTFDELLAAVWGDEPHHVEAEVNRLIYDLRHKIELNPKEPHFLETVRGLGYRLVTRPE